MKKIPLLKKLTIAITLFVLFANVEFAQNTFPSTGAVGIYTTSPANPLHVVGKTRFDVNATGAGGGRFYFNRPSTSNYECALQFCTGGTSTYDWVMGTSTNASDWYFGNAVGRVMTSLASNGNIGIGGATTVGSSPTAKLSVNGDFLVSSSGTSNAPYILHNSNYSSAGVPEYTWYSNTNTGIFHPATNIIGLSANGTEAMRIGNGTNPYVGIANTNPQYPLDVTGNTRIAGSLTSSSLTVSALAGTGNNRLVMAASDGTLNYLSAGTSSQVLYGNGVWGNLPAAQWSTAANGALYVSSNIGVGTSNPQYPLDVTGNAHVTGNVTVGGTVTVNQLNISQNISSPKLVSNRIISPDTNGIHFGDSSLVIAYPTPVANNTVTLVNNVPYESFYVNGSGNNLAIGHKLNYAVGGNSMAIGTSNIKAFGKSSIALGMAGTETDGDQSMAIGWNVKTTQASHNSIALGCGYTGHPMTNTVPNSLAVGFNSDVPTLFVGGGNGQSGSVGNVGIGLGNTLPSFPLDIGSASGTALIRSGNTTTNLIMGYNGAGNVIESQGGSLMVNWGTGRDVAICTGAGGVLSVGNNMEVAIQAAYRETSTALNIRTNGTTTGLKIQDVNNNKLFTVSNDGSTLINCKNTSGSPITVKNTDLSTTHSWNSTIFEVVNNGGVFIGAQRPAVSPYNDPSTVRLTVDGTVVAKEIYVETSSWADYVFNKDYKLKPLDEVEKYISINQHLPNVPSATEIESEGQSIGGLQVKQMEKIEELTLYLIDLNKRIQILEKENKKLNSELNIFKKQ